MVTQLVDRTSCVTVSFTPDGEGSTMARLTTFIQKTGLHDILRVQDRLLD